MAVFGEVGAVIRWWGFGRDVGPVEGAGEAAVLVLVGGHGWWMERFGLRVMK